jgi:hypothetical protein
MFPFSLAEDNGVLPGMLHVITIPLPMGPTTIKKEQNQCPLVTKIIGGLHPNLYQLIYMANFAIRRAR